MDPVLVAARAPDHSAGIVADAESLLGRAVADFQLELSGLPVAGPQHWFTSLEPRSRFAHIVVSDDYRLNPGPHRDWIFDTVVDIA